MKKDTSYYTPSMEELHIGMEIELNGHGVEGLWWFKRKIEEPMDLYLYLSYLIPGRFAWTPEDKLRVKYLDEDDIKSIGFEESPDEPGEWYWKYKGDINIQLYFDDKIENKTKGVGISIYNPELVFSGYIRNKSELKILLKQLNIYEEGN